MQRVEATQAVEELHNVITLTVVVSSVSVALRSQRSWEIAVSPHVIVARGSRNTNAQTGVERREINDEFERNQTGRSREVSLAGDYSEQYTSPEESFENVRAVSCRKEKRCVHAH